MARRSEMQDLVAATRASEEARERTKVMLLTLAKQWTVQEGCARLKIGRTRFQDLRRQMLAAAVAVFERGQPGRPARDARRRSRRERELEQEVARLRFERRVLRTQLDLEHKGLGPTIRLRQVAMAGGA